MQHNWLAAFALGCVLFGQGVSLAQADENAGAESKTDAFFAGTVVETTAEKITVARTVLGKAENHSFLVTPGTKIEGKLRTRVRVTVRYISDESGDTATMIIVRAAASPSPAQKKKQ